MGPNSTDISLHLWVSALKSKKQDYKPHKKLIAMASNKYKHM